jgi:hypothetical protein
VGALGCTRSPLEDLHNGAVFGLTRGDGATGGEAFGAQQRDVLAGELEQVRLFARLRAVGRDDDGGVATMRLAIRLLMRSWIGLQGFCIRVWTEVRRG